METTKKAKKRNFMPAACFCCLVLTTMLGCGNSVTTTEYTAAPGITDYALKTNWQTLPKTASQPVDVFFVYPSTYFPNPANNGPTYTTGWNQTIELATADPGITNQVASKASVFYKAGTNLYVPYYRQSAGINVLQALLWGIAPANIPAANQAMETAYSDVSDAFTYFLQHYNKDASGKSRPFILAGHSQGSNLLLLLLERRFGDAALRKQLVAAYIIGWSVTEQDMQNYPALTSLGICSSSNQTGCIITYNTQELAGDWSLAVDSTHPTGVGIVKPNAYSVNPLTWVATSPNGSEATAAPASANLGAVFYKFQPPANPQLVPPVGQSEVNWVNQLIGGVTVDAVKIPNYTGAQNNQGALVIDPSQLPAPGTFDSLNLPYSLRPGWYHNYDYAFFFFNLEENVTTRINAYNASR